jgi:hypothetical protein
MKYAPNLLPFVSLGASLLFLAGCGTAYRVTPITSTRYASPETWTERPHWYERGYRLDRNIYLNPYTYNPRNTKLIAGANAAGDRATSFYGIASDPAQAGTDAARIARNQLQNAIMRVSDQMTAAHLSELKSTENNGNILLGATTLGLTGGASVAGAATAKALAAAATGTGGARELFNNQVYRNALVETLIGAIEADRITFGGQIRAKQAKPIADYDVEAALRNACEYHLRGSFYHGLALIREAAEADSHTKKTDSKNLQ